MRSFRLSIGMVAAALTIAVSGMTAGQAVAEPGSLGPASTRLPFEVSPLSTEQCAYGYYCAWENENWSGSFWYWGEPKNSWFYVGAGANDRISSDWNRHQNGTYVAQNYPPGTYQFCTSAGGSHESYGDQYYPQPPYPSANDSISAVDLTTAGC